MASPQIENGYIKIANEFMLALIKSRIPGQERQIFDAIISKTWGFNKKHDAISNSQFQKLTGLHKVAVCKAVNNLLFKNMITKKGNTFIPTYGIQKNYLSWRLLPKKVTVTNIGNGVTKNGNGVTKNGNRLLPKMVPTKDTSTKDTSTKDIIYTSNFLEFWKMYPIKVAKRACFKVWKDKVKSNGRPSIEIIIASIEDQKKSERWLDGFIPNPETWLNQGRWDDELPAPLPYSRKTAKNIETLKNWEPPNER